MPDIDQIFILIEKAFGSQVASWLIPLLVIGLLLWLVGQILNGVRTFWLNTIQPFLQDSETKQRIRNRQLFAKHIQSGIERLNRKESWQDHHFTELEAEIEIDGPWRSPKYRWLPIRFTFSGRKRESSLSKALESSQAKRILLEGDPGSGKSVALRHIAIRLAEKVAKQNDERSLIPLYINLKDLVRPSNEKVDRAFIKRFVFESVRRELDSDIERFVESEFEQGMHNGTWLFLFDSFDEIPEVLSSTETDNIVASYAEAIIDFLSGANRCRGILASRHFRGPSDNTFSKFQILPLSSKRITGLIRNSNLKPKLQDDLIGQLPNAPFEIQEMVQNPMFLSLLCQHMAGGNEFPSNSHVVFESFILARLDRDKDQIKNRFNVTVQEVRQAAENIAFAMLEADHLGLNPSRKALEKSIIQQNLPIPSNLMNILDALVDIRLAKSENLLNAEKQQETTFSFVHRRFQEYFATSFLLRNPDRIDINRLALDARWRETMVVLLQTQEEEQVKRYLVGVEKNLYALTDKLLQQIKQAQLTDPAKKMGLPTPFAWPPKLLHLLSLLQDGLTSRPHLLAEDTREDLSTILKFAYYQGILLDKKWVIEVASTMKSEDFLQLIRDSLSSTSGIIQDVVYQQIPRLVTVPSDINQWIREALLRKYAFLSLYIERFTVQAHLARIPKSKDLLKALDILLFTYSFNALIHAILLLLYIYGIIFYFRPYTGISEEDPILSWLNFITNFLDIRIFCVILLIITILSSLVFSVYLVSMMEYIETIVILVLMPSLFMFVPLFFIRYEGVFVYIPLMIIYCIIWVHTCLYAVKWNKYRFSLFYPLIPISLLLELILDVDFLKSKILRFIKESSLLQLSIYPFIVSIIMGIIFYISRFLPSWFLEDVVPYVVVVFLCLVFLTSIGVLIFSVPYLYSFVKMCIKPTKDYFRDGVNINRLEYYKDSIELRKDFLKYIRMFNTMIYFSQIILIMRSCRDIDDVDEIEDIVIHIIRCGEYFHNIRASKSRMNKETSMVLADLKMINSILATPPFQPSDYRWIKELEARHLDQLTLFLEHLRRIKNTSASKVSLQQS